MGGMSDKNATQIQQATPSRETARRLFELRSSLARQHSYVVMPGFQRLLDSLFGERFQGRQRHFSVVRSGGDWRVHVLGRVSPTLEDAEGKPIGMLGFFDAEDDRTAVSDTLGEAICWLKTEGCRTIIGPIDGDTWHAYRFNSGPFEERAFLGEPTNPEYYGSLWEQAGFELVESYHSLAIDNIEPVLPRLETQYRRALSLGFTFRALDLRDFDNELTILYGLSTASFKDNLFYDAISLDEFQKLYRPARSLLTSKSVWLALDPKGEPVGFLFCIIDFGRAVAAMEGKNNLWAKIKFLLNRKNANAVNFKSIAVVPEHRRSSVATALMYKGYEAALELGFRRANLCLIRDGNPSARMDGGQGRTIRTYRLYQYPTIDTSQNRS